MSGPTPTRFYWEKTTQASLLRSTKSVKSNWSALLWTWDAELFGGMKCWNEQYGKDLSLPTNLEESMDEWHSAVYYWNEPPTISFILCNLAIIFDHGAKVAYYRMIPSQCMILYAQAGVSPSAIQMKLTVIKRMKYFVKTAYYETDNNWKGFFQRVFTRFPHQNLMFCTNPT